MPTEVPGIAFLSGGQTELQSTENLNLINKLNTTNFIMSYSYGQSVTTRVLLNFGQKIYKTLKELKKYSITEQK